LFWVIAQSCGKSLGPYPQRRLVAFDRVLQIFAAVTGRQIRICNAEVSICARYNLRAKVLGGRACSQRQL